MPVYFTLLLFSIIRLVSLASGTAAAALTLNVIDALRNFGMTRKGWNNPWFFDQLNSYWYCIVIAKLLIKPLNAKLVCSILGNPTETFFFYLKQYKYSYDHMCHLNCIQ